MTPEELHRRQERAERETLIISSTDGGFRVYPPVPGATPFVVRLDEEVPTCTCVDFQKHQEDPEWRCKHILAVLTRMESEGSALYDREERRAIQNEERSPERNAAPDPERGPSQMLLKRSVSPDGRIDALSIEFSCLVEQVSVSQIRSRAESMLQLQRAIVEQFLNGNDHPSREPRSTQPVPDGPMPAKMLDIGGMDGRWGRRLFIRIQTNSRILRLYGSEKQLSEHIVAAGFPQAAKTIGEGVQLNLPCRVITKLSDGGRFLNVEKVLPADQRTVTR